MTISSSTQSTSAALDRYERKTPRSRKLFEQANSVVQNGVSRGTLAFAPYPFYAESARGAHITDVDGNVYLDLVNNYTSLPHGHAHGPTTQAALAELTSSSAVGTAHPLEGAYAEELRSRIPSMEKLHFTTTGSEAVAFAGRIARANTGRSRILKFEGGFHGSHGEFYQDIALEPRPAGTSWLATPSSAGLEPTSAVVAVYNDPESVTAAFAQWGRGIAAVVVEPFLGNGALVTATEGFLDRIFEESAAHDTLVVFDEVQSLRAGYGGAQNRWGYTPDLTAIGKIMGGGYALAAFGGRADLMAAMTGQAPVVMQTGTFTAAPMALAGGRAALSALDRQTYGELEDLTEELRVGIRETFARHAVPVHVNGIGSMFNITISAEPVDTYRAHRNADAAAFDRIRLELVSRGVLIMPRGTGCLSTAVTHDDVNFALRQLDAAITHAGV